MTAKDATAEVGQVVEEFIKASQRMGEESSVSTFKMPIAHLNLVNRHRHGKRLLSDIKTAGSEIGTSLSKG